jgi:hypothetical protein
VTADQRGHGVGVALEEYTKTSGQGSRHRGQEIRRGGAWKTEDRQDASSEGMLMQCNGVQRFDVANLLKMERETGIEPATFSLGS